MAVSAARRRVIGVVARGMSTDTQLTSAPASCWDALSSAAGSGLLPLIEELTERELEVVAGVARGLTNQGIGSSLGISVETVKTHVVNANDKLGAADRTQLAVMALLYGLIDPLG